MIEIRPFAETDYDAARALWERTEGIGLSAADERGAIASYLARNPGSSFVAMDGATLVGTVLCGHDGRRGLIHHLATAGTHRRRGIARRLLEHALLALRSQGVEKCHLLVFRDNHEALAFWKRMGAEERLNLSLVSIGTAATR
jgi:ribosomal protein S18 acetylase RimI-like enzyme